MATWLATTRSAVSGRWGVVVLLHVTVALVGTLSTAKGVFFPALVREFQLTHAAGAALLSISSLFGGLVAVGAGWLMLRLARVEWVLAAVVAAATGGYLLAAAAHNYQQLLLAYVLMSGALVNQVAMAYVLTNWFADRRGIALALTYAGTTTGGVLLTPVISHIVNSYGWRVGYQALAVALLLLPPLLLALIRSHPRSLAGVRAVQSDPSPLGLTVREALRTRSFWLILFAGMMNCTVGATTIGAIGLPFGSPTRK